MGVLPATTGEARLLELTGLVDSSGILAAGTRVETPLGTVVADGTAAYTVTAAGSTPNLAGRSHLYPPLENMPQVIYLGDEVGESELVDALAAGRIDAIARGEIGNRDAVQVSGNIFVVTALDTAFELGGFTLAVEDAALATCIDEKLNYLTDNRNIGYAEVGGRSFGIHAPGSDVEPVGSLTYSDIDFERKVMEWIAAVVVVVLLTGLGIVTGHAIRHAKKS